MNNKFNASVTENLSNLCFSSLGFYTDSSFKSSLLSLGLVVLLVSMLIKPVFGEMRFEEVSSNIGISHDVESWGAAWGDFNGDGNPDIWATNHFSHPSLYVNQGDGSFVDVASSVMMYQFRDTHGAAWGDHDNDGDQDLIELSGMFQTTSISQNTFFVNDKGFLWESAGQWGVDYFQNRGRTPLWLDWDRDGLLDLVLAGVAGFNGEYPSAIFRQTPKGFMNKSEEVQFDCSEKTMFATISDVSGDGLMDLICHGWTFPQRIYNMAKTPFEDITDIFPKTSQVNDAKFADFNGDLRPDVFLTRVLSDRSNVVLLDDTTINAVITIHDTAVKGFAFKSLSTVEFDFSSGAGPAPKPTIYVGATGWQPKQENLPGTPRYIFSLSSSDPSVWGMKDYVVGQDEGVYIGYSQTANEWQVKVVGAGRWKSFYSSLKSGALISNLRLIGFKPQSPTKPRMLIRTDNGFEDRTVQSGLDTPVHCEYSAVGDFDNDMDLDLYLACHHSAVNLPNILYENKGDGTFEKVTDGAGASGPRHGAARNLAIADYDADGFLDIFVQNGVGAAPTGLGPNQLFRNLGNGNNWLELDLEGTSSNRDGVGTRLFLTAGGKTQLQEVGSMGHGQQDYKRVHFGMAGNKVADKLTIHWPSGVTQELKDIPANQVVRVIEPSKPSILGKPSYELGQDSGVYLWKDDLEGPYKLRVIGEGLTYRIRLIADSALEDVAGYSLENGDNLSWSGNHFTLQANLGPGVDGVDFRLPTGAKALIGVDQEGVVNPRQLHVGANGKPLSPSGWVVSAGELPSSPSFTEGSDLGLFVGREATNNTVLFRWSGDGSKHSYHLNLLASNSVKVLPVSLEQNDMSFSDTYSSEVKGYVSVWLDGVDVAIPAQTLLGFEHIQDELPQPYRVNPSSNDLGLPNAYWLPME